MKASVTRFLAHFGFWLATLVMAVMGWTLYQATSDDMESSLWVSHTRQVLQTVGEIKDALGRAETAQSGYLLAGSDALLAERGRAIETVNGAVIRLQDLTSGSPVQQGKTSQLKELIEARIALMRDNARRNRAKGIDIAEMRAASGVGEEARVAIDDLTAELRQVELKVLEVRGEDVAYRDRTEAGVLVAAVLFGVIVLIPGYLGFILQSRARERTERMLRLMADSLPGAMYQLRHDAKGKPRFTFMSAGVTNVCGIAAPGSAGALPGWNAMVDAIDERDRPQFVAAVAACMHTLAPFRQDYRVGNADGSFRWLHHEASLHREPGGSILMNGYVADITEQTRLKDALQDSKESADSANRAKSTFLATMSHEIRTPMNGVLGMLELLNLTRLDAEQRATLEIVRVSSESLLRIIDDILDFSKIEAGRLEFRPEVASIRDIVKDVHNTYSGNASSKGLLISCSTDPRISPASLVDAMRLRQILNNFVSNALKFTSRGSIEIKVQLIERVGAEDRVRFSVQDTGIGISAQDQRHLFQPFSQGGGDAARRAGGSGLGLTICRRLAGMMGGSVEMLSDSGKGTTMTLALALPVADPKDLPSDSDESAREWLVTTTSMRRVAPGIAQAEKEGTLALLVDDHPINRTLLMRQVQALGYAAECAENGVEALEKWKSGRYGIVITDCNMPGMDGYELARSIRRLEAGRPGRRTPIIACTANALRGEAEACLAAGMDDCLVKPAELAQILKKLDQWLAIPSPAERPAAVGTGVAAAGAPIDRSVLAGISGGDAAAEREILADFRRANDEDAALLKRAVAAGDVPQVTHATHRILGASRMVGAAGLAGICERIGLASRSNDWSTVASGMKTFEQEWTCLNAYFDSL